MIPLVGLPKELALQIAIVHRVADAVAREKEARSNYRKECRKCNPPQRK
jgi:hypothetical protein